MVRFTSANRHKSRSCRRSESGQSRRFDGQPITSGLPRLADVFGGCRHVAKVPTADLLAATSLGSCAARPLALKLLRLSKFLSGNACRGQADLEEIAHEAQEVDIAGGELRSRTWGLDPLSCRLCRTTRTMSEYRSLGQSGGLLSLPAWPDTP